MSDENQQQERSVPETSEGLVSLAQEYFSREFPNSGRGCPSPNEMAQQIEAGHLPDDALRKHLLACSSCFVTYREHLQKSCDVYPAPVPRRRRIADLLHNPWMRVLAPSLPVLLLAVVAVFYLRPTNTQQNVTSVNAPTEVVNANATAVTTVSPSPVQIDSPTQLDRSYVVRVDLRNYSPRRGSETSAEPPPLQIEQKPTVFTITLPEDSLPGAYFVSILDSFGKQIRTRTAFSADGKRLTATLNLDNLRSRNYRLCVSRSDEPPNCHAIVITNRGK